jgi:gamma-glutamyltranspeptidase/glutathione hydrolase
MPSILSPSRLLPLLALSLSLCALESRAAVPVAVEASHGVVVSSQHLASQVGVDILKAGGNAIDAAVAVGYAEAVTNPCCANIGGGGFMVVHLAESHRDVFVNFRETAPQAATAAMFLEADGTPIRGASLDGYLAVAVPGTVLGLDDVLKRYGTLPRAVVMAPAIKLARDGFILTRGDTDIIDAGSQRLSRNAETRKLFFREDGSPLRPGDRLKQPDLARTLEAVAHRGANAFYKSAIAGRVAAAMRRNGGIITRQDLASYTVTEGAPIYCTYRGYLIASAPPPSSGGTALCEILNILEGYDMRGLGFHSAASAHYMVEAMRRAYIDRNTSLGDPAFVKNPVEHLLSKDYAAQVRKTIDPERATLSRLAQPDEPPNEKPETTHYSIVDGKGNAVAVTYTINGLFGAGIIVPGTGFLLNDEMDDFTAKTGAPNLFGLVQGEANAIAPGKRPLSSMSPTIVTKDGHVVMVLGSPGGSRIITITLQVLLNIIDYGMRPQEAVDAPRLHYQGSPDEIYVEPFALSPDTVRALQARDYRITEQAPWGAAELIALPEAAPRAMQMPSGNDSAVSGQMLPGFVYGAHDDRRPAGAAVGF